MEKKEINQEKFNHLVSLLRAERSVAIFVAIYLKWYPEHRKRLQNILDITCCKAPRGMISFAQARISEGEDKKHDSIIGIVQALIFSLRSFPGLRYKLRKIRSYLFIKEYYGQSRFFSSIPIFYFYSAFKLCVNRLRR